MDNESKAIIAKLKRELEREKLAKLETEYIAEKTTFNLHRIKTKFQTIVDTTKDGIAILDLETKFLYSNNSYLKMTGFTNEELLTKSCVELTAPEDLQRAQKAVEETIEKGFVENLEKTCIVKDGKRVGVSISISLLPDKKRMLIVVRDISKQKKQKKLLDDYIKIVNQNVITSSTDLEGEITYVSDAFCEISGYSEDELIGKKHNIVRHPDTKDAIYKQMWDTLSLGMTWVGEIKNKKKNGQTYWVEASISPIFDESEKKIGYTSVRKDITDKKILEEISITDGLTHIYNRRHFNEVFTKILNSAKRDKKIECFMLIDIDYFKQYNDTYGHQMGDNALIEVAFALKDSLKRADDYCFRLGGEEFGILYKTDLKDKAVKFANKIRENIQNLKIPHCKNSVSDYISISAGLRCIEVDEIRDMKKIYNEADKLLYKAKKMGRNRVIHD